MDSHPLALNSRTQLQPGARDVVAVVEQGVCWMTGSILEDDPKLRLVVERLVSAYRPDHIYLFGSIALGDADADSDYDLMLLVPDDADPERRSSRLAYQALRGTGIAADVLVWTSSGFERRVRVVASLPATVLREGKLLYAA